MDFVDTGVDEQLQKFQLQGAGKAGGEDGDGLIGAFLSYEGLEGREVLNGCDTPAMHLKLGERVDGVGSQRQPGDAPVAGNTPASDVKVESAPSVYRLAADSKELLDVTAGDSFELFAILAELQGFTVPDGIDGAGAGGGSAAAARLSNAPRISCRTGRGD